MTPECKWDANAVLQKDMSMTLMTMAIDNEYETMGVPKGDNKSRVPIRGLKKEGPVAHDLMLKRGAQEPIDKPAKVRESAKVWNPLESGIHLVWNPLGVENPSRAWNPPRGVALRIVLRAGANRTVKQ